MNLILVLSHPINYQSCIKCSKYSKLCFVMFFGNFLFSSHSFTTSLSLFHSTPPPPFLPLQFVHSCYYFCFFSFCIKFCFSCPSSFPPSLPIIYSLSSPFNYRLVGLVVRRPPREWKIPGSNPACVGIFSGSSHTSDSKNGTPVATLPGAWRYRVSAGSGRPGVCILLSVYCDWVK